MRVRLWSASLVLSVLGAGTAGAQVAAPQAPTRAPATSPATPPSVAGAQPARAARGLGRRAESARSAAGTLALAGRQIDINHASAADLKTVPGIGDAYAAKIIAGRPYTDKGQLVSKKVLPAGVYAKVKERLVAHL